MTVSGLQAGAGRPDDGSGPVPAYSGDRAERPDGRTTRARLAHVDAMRPVKQLGVVSTHSLLAFAPASLAVGAGLILLHVAREGFLFVSACMLTYGYRDLRARDLPGFWRRRGMAVVVPYVCWTLVYFLVGLPGARGSVGATLGHLGVLVLTGYSQLYFLVILVEFYLVFPGVAWLLRRTDGHHGALLAVSGIVQVVYVSAMHWHVLPGALVGTSGTRIILSYQLYLLAGSVAAVHYEAFHGWVVHHKATIVLATVLTGALAEAWYWAGADHVVRFIGSSGGAFQPIVVPFNVAAILLIYLAGVSLAAPGRSKGERRLVQVGVEDSYAVYLSQVLFIDLLAAAGWRSLGSVLPWPLVVALGVVVVFACGCLVGEVLARTPLARPLAGRSRAPRRPPSVPEPPPHARRMPPVAPATAARMAP